DAHHYSHQLGRRQFGDCAQAHRAQTHLTHYLDKVKGHQPQRTYLAKPSQVRRWNQDKKSDPDKEQTESEFCRTRRLAVTQLDPQARKDWRQRNHKKRSAGLQVAGRKTDAKNLSIDELFGKEI